MIVPTIVTLEEAQAHLRLSPGVGSPADDPDLQMKLDAATEVICRRIAQRQPPDDEWVATIESWGLGGSPSTPPLVRLAVLEQVAEMYRFRGDDTPDDRPENYGDICDSIKSLLKAGGYLVEIWA